MPGWNNWLSLISFHGLNACNPSGFDDNQTTQGLTLCRFYPWREYFLSLSAFLGHLGPIANHFKLLGCLRCAPICARRILFLALVPCWTGRSFTWAGPQTSFLKPNDGLVFVDHPWSKSKRNRWINGKLDCFYHGLHGLQNAAIT